MSIVEILRSDYFAGFIANTAIQLLLMTVISRLINSWCVNKTASVKSLISLGTMIALLLMCIFSIIFHLNDISWLKMEIPLSYQKKAQKADFSPNSNNTGTNKPLPGPFTDVSHHYKPSFSPFTRNKGANIPEKRIIESKNVKKPISIASSDKKAKAASYSLKIKHFVITVNIFGLVWLSGAVFLIARLVYGLIYIHGFRHGLIKIEDKKINQVLELLPKTFNVKKIPEVYESSAIETPITVGLTNSIVILPAKLYHNMSEDEFKSVLFHEFAHIYHLDHLVGILQRIVVSFNWWNPLVYLISNDYSESREEICDSYSIKELNSAKAYSECLIGLAEKTCLISKFPSAIGMFGNNLSLKERIKKILNRRNEMYSNVKAPVKWLVLAIYILSALLIVGIQSGFAYRKTLKKTEPDLKKSVTFKDHDSDSSAAFDGSFVQVNVRDFKFPHYDEKGVLQVIIYGEAISSSGILIELQDLLIDCVKENINELKRINDYRKIKLYDLNETTENIESFWRNKSHTQAFLRSKNATVNQSKKIISGNNKISFRSPSIDIDGVGYDYDYTSQQIHIRSKVKVHIRTSNNKRITKIPFAAKRSNKK